MYKVYIETENNTSENQMNELAELVGKELLKNDNIIVYINGSNVDRAELTDLKLDAFVRLQDKSETKGPEVSIHELSKVSNGIGKEIYRELQKVYYDKTIDKGLIYIKEKFGAKDTPSVIVNVISKANLEDKNWLLANMASVARAIGDGIKISFTLKQC